jgi:hypothetical protein
VEGKLKQKAVLWKRKASFVQGLRGLEEFIGRAGELGAKGGGGEP